MSQIPFVNQLGDALDDAIASTRASRPRRVLGRRPWRLAVVLAVVVAGVAGAAQTLLSSSQKAAINGIGCYDGTNAGASGTFDVYGPSPIAACRQVFAVEHSPLASSSVPLVACVGGQGPSVLVFKAQGTDQCQRLGYSALPTSYAAAATNVATLDRAIIAAWRSADCIPPAQLAQKLDGVLARLGWAGWHAVTQAQPTADGPCGNVGYDGDGQADPSGSLIASNHTLMVSSGASQSITDLSMQLNQRLTDASGERCMTTAQARASAETMIPAADRPATFTLTSEPRGGTFGDARQARYDSGCTIIISAGAGTDGHTIEVDLENRSAPPPVQSANAPGVAGMPAPTGG